MEIKKYNKILNKRIDWLNAVTPCMPVVQLFKQKTTYIASYPSINHI